MHGNADDSVDAIVTTVTRYLQSHPLAADSVQGVARWWLGSSHDGASLGQVQRALDRLVTMGVMRRLPLLDGTQLYSQVPPTRQ